jgi:hypothetical protein
MKKILALFLLLLSSGGFAQGKLPLTTGQTYVTAIVDHGSGWVQVKQYPGRNLDATLSYYQKSFVSYDINGAVFTNNDVGLPSPLPANTFILKDGVLSKRKGIKANTDTIVCTWANKNGVDLVQEVYPVLLERSEQIVYRWKAINKSSLSITASVQYLLDVQVGDKDYTNDGAPILTSNGYSPTWKTFDGSSNASIPTFTMTFQYPLPNSPSFNPGITAANYTDSTYYDLGLTKPSRITIGNWPDMIPVRLGPPSPLPSGLYTDAAVLYEFQPKTSTKSEILLGSTSYGTAEFETCRGQMFAIAVFPQRIRWSPPNLVPNPFTVEMYLFNPQQFGNLAKVDLTLTVGQDLTIVDPLPTFNNGKSQTQILGVIPPLGEASVKWKVQASKSTTCSKDVMSLLKFNAVAPGLGYPVFVNEETGTDTCEHPIIIECSNPNRDTLPPIHSPVIVDALGDKSMGIRDNGSKDSGLKSISWSAVGNTDTSNFIFNISPSVTGCSKSIHTLTLHQIDSTKAGCFDIVFEDCVGNKADTVICFGAHYPPHIPDTIAPKVFDKLLLTSKFASFIMTDTSARDTGISQFIIMPPTFGTASTVIDPTLTPCSKLVHQVYLRRTDSVHAECIKYSVIDCAGNQTIDSICFPGTLAVPGGSTETIFSILGNPSSGKATIQLTLERAQDMTLRIVDAIGREVRRVDVKGLMQGENLIPLQTGELASGTYYVIVEIDGKQLAKNLKVVR